MDPEQSNQSPQDQDKSHQQESDPVKTLMSEGYLRLYQEDVLQTRNLSKEEILELYNHLHAPVVTVYLKEVSHQIVADLLRLTFERNEDQLKLAARYAYGRGALELIHNIVTMENPNTERK